jgi:uncharacterized membrane protein
MEKFFDEELTNKEKNDFENMINSNKDLKTEFEEQKRVKEVLKKMKMKDPSSETWDNYREKTYNKLERGLGWMAIFLGALIILGFVSVEFVNQLYSDNSTPIIIKIGTVSLVFGFLVLLFSVIREKIFTRKTDKYKEIQR